MAGIVDLAGALTRLKEIAASWLRDAEGVAIGVVAGRVEDDWVALRVEVATFEDEAGTPADLDGAGLDELKAERWRVPAGNLDLTFGQLAEGIVTARGLGRVRLPLPLPGGPQLNRHPEVSLRVLASGWPHHRVEAFGTSPNVIFGEQRIDDWDRDLRVRGIDGVAGLFGLVGADPTEREVRMNSRILVIVPRFVSIARYRRDGDDLHIQVRACRESLHEAAEILVFASPEPRAIVRAALGQLRRACPDGPLWWTVRLPPHTRPRIDLVEDGRLLQSCEVEYQSPPPMLQRDDGSYVSDDPQRAARLHQEVFVLTHTKPKDRGARFERFVHEALDLAGLRPVGSVRVGGRQIDNAIVLDGRSVLIEATTDTASDYLDKVMGRLRELADDARARCVLVVPIGPQQPQLDRAEKLHRITFMTGEEVRLFLGGVFRLTDLLRWRLRGLEVGKVFAPIDEFLASLPDPGGGGVGGSRCATSARRPVSPRPRRPRPSQRQKRSR